MVLKAAEAPINFTLAKRSRGLPVEAIGKPDIAVAGKKQHYHLQIQSKRHYLIILRPITFIQ
ncbi:hypothetical protein DXT99_13675 [Pontibacter diazotrophicus]|uniref:Uncharacterized protein n=1 Tax=Pontibacter diazotrophicus TaxID=1400979 RepID=A0A3D8LBD5_9BACT|nr:hypothetical protein DXT99_13675 [Pontibacter diazotrophicus]